MNESKNRDEIHKELHELLRNTISGANGRYNIDQIEVHASYDEIEYKAILQKGFRSKEGTTWEIHHGIIQGIGDEGSSFYVADTGSVEIACDAYFGIDLGSGDNENLQEELRRFIDGEVTKIAESALLDSSNQSETLN